MPINVENIIQAHPYQAPLLGIIGAATILGFLLMLLGLHRNKPSLSTLGFALFATSMVACFPLDWKIGQERASDLAQQIKENYGLEVSAETSRTLLHANHSEVKVSKGASVYVLDVTDSGDLVVTDTTGRIIKPNLQQ